MDSSIVTAGAALGGSLVGALASFTSTWLTQRYQGRRDYLARQIARRESLYAEFINEATRLYSEALVDRMEKPAGMAKIWSLVARIRLSASAPVLASSEKILERIADQFAAEPLTLAQVRELAQGSDPLQEFGDACRAELDDIDSDR